MSQSTKRDANTAFPTPENNSTHKAKRVRNSRRVPSQLAGKSATPVTLSTEAVSKGLSETRENEKSPASTRVRHRNRKKHIQAVASQPPEVLAGESLPVSLPTKTNDELHHNLETADDGTPNPHKKRNRRKRQGGDLSPLHLNEEIPSKESPGSATIANTIPKEPVSLSAYSPELFPHEGDTQSTPSTRQKFAEAAQKDGLAVSAQPPDVPRDALVLKKAKSNQKHKKPSVTTGLKGDTASLNIGEWSFSPSKGGVFIDQDPLLSYDGQYLFLPTHSEVQIYATQTSLLVRSLSGGYKSDITHCALSGADPEKLYIALSNGVLSVWNWTKNEKLGQINTKSRLRQVLPLGFNSQDETILLLQHSDDASSSVKVYTVSQTDHKFKTPAQVLHRSLVLKNLDSYAQGSVLIASSSNKLLLGYSQDVAGGASEMIYTWREISVPGLITAFHGQVVSNASKGARKVPVVNVVIGLKTGIIMQYEDLLYKLIGKEKKSTSNDIIPRTLHWHRTAVNTVKWARDGNYIISGGNETVLVVWQLDTNQKQFLPHLSTSILNLTVSAKGSEYAIRLGDNSVMVLSTTDLLPSTNVAGLAFSEDDAVVTPVVFHPSISNRLIAAVPATPITKNRPGDKSATCLQQFDVGLNVQTSRQALSRNFITTKNVTPGGQRVSEPSVTHIAISNDGKWLATIDEWSPLSTDTEALYLRNDTLETKERSKETCLRFWTWSDDENVWDLVTRVDQPHQGVGHSVLGLAANASQLEFATIGSDSVIQIWSPKMRHRNGVPVKDKYDEQLYTWSGTRSVDVGHDAPDKSDLATSAELAYSEDGSTLAASWSWLTSQTRMVHIIDPVHSRICLSSPDLVTVGDAKLAFAGRYLLCLSHTFCALDMLTTENVLTITMDPDFVGPRHLAVNKYDNTVAIAITRPRNERSTKLLILSCSGREVKPVYETSMRGLIQGLLASPIGQGYTLIDDKSRVKTLRSGQQRRQAAAAVQISGAEPDQVKRSLDSIFGKGSQSATSTLRGEEGANALLADETNAAASSSSSLDAVLNFVSSAQAPGPVELFQRVVGAVGRRGINNPVAA